MSLNDKQRRGKRRRAVTDLIFGACVGVWLGLILVLLMKLLIEGVRM